MNFNTRREFLKKSGLSMLPFFFSPGSLGATTLFAQNKIKKEKLFPVNFVFDGLFFSPEDYIAKLNEINKSDPIEPDFYGKGGVTEQLEKEFANITGKEKAVYLPTGTMANQLAIKVLNGSSTKVVVPENSHVFRDEADAAQSVNNKRLIPLGKGKFHFELEDLINEIDYLDKSEVFKSGLGTVMVENPVRRADERVVPIETIKKISNYCRQNGYKLHLDGARIHIASAFTGIPVKEYASYFDTVYISLYKYLNAGSGAILCGDSETIDQIPHLIKIYGGTELSTWNNTAVALHYLNGIEERWTKVIKASEYLISELNKIDGVNISGIQNGTNIFNLNLADEIKYDELRTVLNEEYNILLRHPTEEKTVKFVVNESIMTRDLKEIINAWKKGVENVKS
jgi:threonine aldolase